MGNIDLLVNIEILSEASVSGSSYSGTKTVVAIKNNLISKYFEIRILIRQNASDCLCIIWITYANMFGVLKIFHGGISFAPHDWGGQYSFRITEIPLILFCIDKIERVDPAHLGNNCFIQPKRIAHKQLFKSRAYEQKLHSMHHPHS